MSPPVNVTDQTVRSRNNAVNGMRYPSVMPVRRLPELLLLAQQCHIPSVWNPAFGLPLVAGAGERLHRVIC